MLTFMASCNSAPAEDSLQTSIEKMEVEIKQHAELDTAMARKLTDAYLEYAQLHPEDSIAPYYVSRAAEIYKEMPGRALTAVVTYNKVITDYPENPLAARSVFMIGFVFDDKLQDTARAAKSYSHFLKAKQGVTGHFGFQPAWGVSRPGGGSRGELGSARVGKWS